MVKPDEDLKRDIEELSKRVSRLEAAAESSARPRDPSPVLDEERFWALTGLQSRLDDDPSTAAGAVMLVGSLTMPDGAPVAWQQAAATSDLWETNWADHAAVFSALAHPVRLELLRNILLGTHATSDLAEIATLGTTGQLHHHLRQLVATGWVKQVGRGNYEVPAARVVPLLVSLVVAQR